MLFLCAVNNAVQRVPLIFRPNGYRFCWFHRQFCKCQTNVRKKIRLLGINDSTFALANVKA